MKKKFIWLALSCLMVTTMVLTSCAKQTTTTSTTTPQTTVTQTPATQTTATQTTDESTPQPQYGGTLKLPLPSFPTHFDPYQGAAANLTIQSLWAENMVQGNWAADRSSNPDLFKIRDVSKDNAKGALAESWETPDLSTLILHIRHGVYFQNKSPMTTAREMTAKDVEYTLHRLLGLGSGFTEASPATGGLPLTLVTSVTATDQWTVTVKYKPSALLVTYLANSSCDAVIPREAVEATGGPDDWRNAVGTGPFTLTDYVSDSSMTFVKNQNYWAYDEMYPNNKLPYVDGVTILLIPDKTTMLAAIRTKKIDETSLGETMPLSYADAQSVVKTNPELVLFSRPTTAGGLLMPVQQKPFDDIRVRMALQMALDVPTINKTYYSGQAAEYPSPLVSDAMTDFAVPFDQWPKELQDEYTYNPDGARKLLAEAGYPNGFNTTIDTSSEFDTDLAQIMKGYFKDIGVTVDVNVSDAATYSANMWSYQFKGLFWAYWMGLDVDPIQCFNFYRGGIPWNLGQVNDPTFNDYCDQLETIVDETEFFNLSKEMNLYGIGQHWVVTLNSTRTFGFKQPWIGGFNGEKYLGNMRLGAIIARTWIDPNLK